ncbi:unnamed protein product, partial [Urochloa humidicola]
LIFSLHCKKLDTTIYFYATYFNVQLRQYEDLQISILKILDFAKQRKIIVSLSLFCALIATQVDFDGLAYFLFSVQCDRFGERVKATISCSSSDYYLNSLGLLPLLYFLSRYYILMYMSVSVLYLIVSKISCIYG